MRPRAQFRYPGTFGPWGIALLALFLLPGCGGDDPMRSPPPAITFDPPDPFCSFDGTSCDAPVEISFRVAESFEADSLTFTLEVDLDSDGTVDLTPDPLTVLTETHPDYVFNLTLPLGTHDLTVEFDDGTGETHTATIPFSVIDCKAPTPICINGLAIELQPLPPDTDADGDGDVDAGAMTISGTDFIASPVTDCSEPIRYSINRSGHPASVDATNLVLTCDDVGTVLVEIHAWDSASGPTGGPNHDYCETYVLVQDNQVDCTN